MRSSIASSPTKSNDDEETDGFRINWNPVLGDYNRAIQATFESIPSEELRENIKARLADNIRVQIHLIDRKNRVISACRYRIVTSACGCGGGQ